jgi:hypothetical protein
VKVPIKIAVQLLITATAVIPWLICPIIKFPIKPSVAKSIDPKTIGQNTFEYAFHSKRLLGK